MRIYNNIMAANTHRQLALARTGRAKASEKLSGGLRVNRAADDAAGLAISEKMRGQIRSLAQASRNATDTISLTQTAEAALAETTALLQRMRELAIQAANDTNTDTDRKHIQDEIKEIIKEIDRIGNTTEFNTKKLLNGDAAGTAEEKAGTARINNNSAAVISPDALKAMADSIGNDKNWAFDGAYMIVRINETPSGASAAAINYADYALIGPDGAIYAIRDTGSGIETMYMNSGTAGFIIANGTIELKMDMHSNTLVSGVQDIDGTKTLAEQGYEQGIVMGKTEEVILIGAGSELTAESVLNIGAAWIEFDGGRMRTNGGNIEIEFDGAPFAFNANVGSGGGSTVGGFGYTDGVTLAGAYSAGFSGGADTIGNGSALKAGTEIVLTTGGGAGSAQSITINGYTITRITNNSVLTGFNITGNGIPANTIFFHSDTRTALESRLSTAQASNPAVWTDEVVNAYLAAYDLFKVVSGDYTATSPTPVTIRLTSDAVLTADALLGTGAGTVESMNIAAGSRLASGTTIRGGRSLRITTNKAILTAGWPVTHDGMTLTNNGGKLEITDGVMTVFDSIGGGGHTVGAHSYLTELSILSGKHSVAYTDLLASAVTIGGGIDGKAVYALSAGSVLAAGSVVALGDGGGVTLDALGKNISIEYNNGVLTVDGASVADGDCVTLKDGVVLTSTGGGGFEVTRGRAVLGAAVWSEMYVETLNRNYNAEHDIDDSDPGYKPAVASGVLEFTLARDSVIAAGSMLTQGTSFGAGTVISQNGFAGSVLMSGGGIQFSSNAGNGISVDWGVIGAGGGVTFIFSKYASASADLANALMTQAGANSGQVMFASIRDMRAKALGVDNLDISTRWGAATASAAVDNAITKVSHQRALLGALQNRLEHAVKNLNAAEENTRASESRIRDADMAREVVESLKQEILEQAAQAMLAHANHSHEAVLVLLQAA